MLKKFLSLFCVFVLALNLLPIDRVNAESLEISSPSVILIEGNSGEILYESNADEQRSIASITKVMTLLLTMEAIESGQLELEQILTASAHASSMGGSDIWLKEGEQMSVDDLIKATVIMSANDAAVVLAEAIAGSEDAFVAMMNEKAQELSMTNTVFKNCNGLDEDGHISTAHDVAIMSNELIKHELIQNYTLTWIDYIRDGETQLVNTNKLINSYSGITGLKTGTTSTAGSCISVTAERNGLCLVAVVLGASDTTTRFADATTLLDYGFANWSLNTAEYECPSELEVLEGMKSFVGTKVVGDADVVSLTAEKSQVQCLIEIEENITAPIEENQTLGYIKIYVGNELKKKLPIVATEYVEKTSFENVFWYLLESFVF